MENSLTGPLARILKANRARFNAKFAEARRYRPKLSAEAFSEHLRSIVAPIVEAVARENPAAAAETAETLYELSLDLIGQELIGPASRYPALNAGWSSVLPSLPHHFVAAPRAVISAVTNALYNLSLTPAVRPNEWMVLMREIAPHCPDVDTLLKVGQVAAWRCGMAHYRQGALEICRTLDEKIVRAVLGVPSSNALPITTILDQLQANPWLEAKANLQSPISSLQVVARDLQIVARDLQVVARDLQVVARVGAFRGFGGLFIVPPIVEPADDHFLVTDGEGTWLLTADVFGATFHRADGQASSKSQSPFAFKRDGTVVANKISRAFPELANATSAAATPTTLAVTTALSHSIYLIAFAE